MFPTYNGFLTKAYGPEVQSSGAPTFLVLVTPPAYDTAHIRIDSPINNKVVPKIKYVLDGLAKKIIIIPIGIGV